MPKSQMGWGHFRAAPCWNPDALSALKQRCLALVAQAEANCECEPAQDEGVK